jgi:hypothetical protein
MFERLGYHQRNLINFIVKHGCKRYSIARDSLSHKIVNSLEKRGILVVNRDFEYWTIKIPRTLFQAAKRLGGVSKEKSEKTTATIIKPYQKSPRI